MAKIPDIKKKPNINKKSESKKISAKILLFFKKLLFGEKQTETSKPTAIQFLKEIGIVFGIFLILNSFVIASMEVPTGSMENTVMTGDFLFVNKYIYGGTTPRTIPFTSIRIPWFRLPAFRDVRRGDPIVFEFPGNQFEVNQETFYYYLKRCVALPGDSLEIRNKALYINGVIQALPKHMKFINSYVIPKGVKDERIFPPGRPYNEDNYGPIRIPAKGDRLSISIQNILEWETLIQREGHTITKTNSNVLIDGKPAAEYTVEDDYYFGMGDNRNDSYDCRFWGYIPKRNIVGTPIIVYWSWNPDIPIYDIFNKLSSIRLNRIGTIIN